MRKSKTLVFTDDERELIQICPRDFSDLEDSFNVLSTINVKEALDYIQNTPYGKKSDLVITDYRMPAMIGLEAAKNLRGIKSYLKVILAPHCNFPDQCLGFFDVIVRKPYSAEKLPNLVLTTSQNEENWLIS